KTLLRCEQTGFSCRGAVIPLKEEAVDGFSAIPLFGHLGSDPCLLPQMPSLPGGGAISPRSPRADDGRGESPDPGNSRFGRSLAGLHRRRSADAGGPL